MDIGKTSWDKINDTYMGVIRDASVIMRDMKFDAKDLFVMINKADFNEMELKAIMNMTENLEGKLSLFGMSLKLADNPKDIFEYVNKPYVIGIGKMEGDPV